MNVRRLMSIRLENDLIREPYDRGIVLVNALRVDVERLLLVSVVDQLAQRVRNGLTVGFSDRGVEEPLDVAPQAQGISDRQTWEGAPDVMASIEIMGVVDQDIQNVTLPLQGEPVVLAKVIVTEIIEELGISQGPFVVRNIGAVEEIAQCLAERRFRDSVLLDQQAFQIGPPLHGLLNSFHEIRLADEAFVNQGIVGARFDGSVGRLLHGSYFAGPGRRTMSVPVHHRPVVTTVSINIFSSFTTNIKNEGEPVKRANLSQAWGQGMVRLWSRVDDLEDGRIIGLA